MSRYLSLSLTFICLISIQLLGQGPGTVYAKKKLKPKVEVTYAEKLGTVPPLRELIPVGPTNSVDRNLAKKNRKGPKDFPGRGRNKIVRPELEHQGVDAIRQTSFSTSAHRMSEPDLNINGITSGFSPNDPTGDIGENHYLQAVNATTLAVFDKSGELLNTFSANTLWDQLGFFSAGDPIVLYDQQNNRWIITEFPNENQLLIAVSANSDPMSSYTVYNFPTPSFPDYPKYGIWDDILTLSTNEDGPGSLHIYLIDKVALMAGDDNPSIQRIELPGNTNTEAGFFVTTPLDWTGSNEPIGGPVFVTLNDSSWGDSEEDQIEVYTINVDFDNSNNTTFDNTSIVTAPFDGFPCSSTGLGFQCVPQSGGEGLDALPELITYQAHYRNFISHESMVFNFITDVTDGENLSGIRWVELRRVPGGEWSLHQEGTFAPDDGLDRFMGSICMDGSGNIALAYNVTSENSFVGVRYTGRRATDPLGEMTIEEFNVVDGSNTINSNGRFGDYSHMSIDPVDDKTFWFTTEYANSDGGGEVNTRIIAFSIEIDTTDIGPTALIAPQNASGLTSNETVTIEVSNFGLETQTVFEVGYIFEGQAPVIEPINMALLPETSFQHTFSSTVDMSALGDYDFRLFTNLTGDESISNDTLDRVVTNLPNRDVSVTAIEGLEGQNCGTVLPIGIVVSNKGTDILNSASLEVVLNNTFVTSIEWTGSLAMGESESVPFELTGFPGGINEIRVTASSPNGAIDEIPSNDSFSTEFTAILDGVETIITLNLDNFPEETNWVLADEAGNVIGADGPYPSFPVAPVIVEEFCLDPSLNYTFTIFDSAGDGICCGFGEGNYNISNAAGELLVFSGGEFGGSETTGFNTDTRLSSRDVSITAVEGLDRQNCGSSIPINILLSNNGIDLLNSAIIEVVLNDTPLESIEWTGSLTTGSSESISFELTNINDGTNQVSVTASSPNGNTDEDLSNNTFSTEFTVMMDAVPIIITLNLDNFPEETSWTLADEAGNIIGQDGPYPAFPTSPTIIEEFCVDPDACFTFTIFDSAGDGICCGFGEGDYNITDGQGNVLFSSEGLFEDSESNDFCATFEVFDNDISVDAIEGLDGPNCASSLPINITISNNGGDVVTSAAVEIMLNDNVQTIDWTGSLAMGESDTISFDLTGFADGANQITVTASSPNGETDEKPSDNTLSREFMNMLNGIPVTLTLNLDNFPEETSWILADDAGNTLGAGGPYPELPAAATIQEEFCLDPNTCYNFTIFDSVGDGLCCDFGIGDYDITDDQGNVLLASDGIFDFSESIGFCATLVDNDISIDGVEGLGGANCANSLPINIMLSSKGSDILNSAVIEIMLNDNPVQSIEWTGSLAMGESEVIPFDLTGFVNGTNQITVTVSSPNGGMDENLSNNTFSMEFTNLLNGSPVLITLNLDDFPEEVNWILADDAGNTLGAGGPYPELPAAATIQEEFCLDPNTCYNFTIFDSASDGICCGFGEGNYTITNEFGFPIFSSDGAFGASETFDFCGDQVTSTTEIESAQFFKAYPNPTDGIFNIEVSGIEHPSVFLDIEIFNTSGQRVQTSKIGKFGEVYKGQVSLYHYPSGAYTIRFISDNITKTMRVVRL